MRPRVPPGFFSLGELLLAPNVVTGTRLVLALAFPLVAGSTPAALLVLLGAAGSDVLDGWLARRGGRVTATGIILDPIADKAFALSVVATLLAERKLPAWGAPCLLVREILEAPLLAWMLFEHSSSRTSDLREVGATGPGKLATVAEFVAVLLAVTAPWALTPALVVAAVAGVAAGVGYWERELARK